MYTLSDNNWHLAKVRDVIKINNKLRCRNSSSRSCVGGTHSLRAAALCQKPCKGGRCEGIVLIPGRTRRREAEVVINREGEIRFVNILGGEITEMRTDKEISPAPIGLWVCSEGRGLGLYPLTFH